MTTEIKKLLMTRIAEVSNDLTTLRRVRMEIATNGVSSASLSSGGGSKSFTRLDLGTVTNLIRATETELAKLRARLNGSEGTLRRIYFVR